MISHWRFVFHKRIRGWQHCTASRSLFRWNALGWKRFIVMTAFTRRFIKLQIESRSGSRLINPWHVLISILLLGMHSLLFIRHYAISLVGIILERIKVIITAKDHSSLHLVFWVVLRELHLLWDDYIMLLKPVPASHLTILTNQWVIFVDCNDWCHIYWLRSICLFEKWDVILGSSLCLGLNRVQVSHASLWCKLENLALIKASRRGSCILLLLDNSSCHCRVQIFLVVHVLAFFHLTLILIICII